MNGIYLSAAELGALSGLPGLAFRLYVAAIRPRMDLATATVGVKVRISWQALAEWCYVEPHQGLTESGSPAKTTLRRAAAWLERAGLVRMYGSREDRQLFFKCLLAERSFSAQKKPGTNPAHQPGTRRDDEEAHQYALGDDSPPATRQTKNSETRHTSEIGDSLSELPPPHPVDLLPGLAAAADQQSDKATTNHIEHWPECVKPEQRDAIAARLAGIDGQLLLDELAGAVRKGRINYPLRLLDSLAKKARAGEFIPDAALDVRKARTTAAAHRRAMEEGAARISQQVKNAPPANVAEMLSKFSSAGLRRRAVPADCAPPNTQT